MSRHIHGRLAAAMATMAMTVLTIGCGSSPTAPQITLTSVVLTGNQTLNAIGQTAQLAATGKYSDGSSKDVTGQASWQSGNASFVSVGAAGQITGTGYGETAVSASYQGMSGNLTVATTLINLTGTWSGTASSSTSSVTFTSSLTQTASAVSGTATFTSPLGSGTGTFTGSVTPAATTVQFTIAASGSVGSTTCSLNYTASGSLSGTTLSGTYTGTNSCSGAISGSFTFTKQ